MKQKVVDRENIKSIVLVIEKRVTIELVAVG